MHSDDIAGVPPLALQTLYTAEPQSGCRVGVSKAPRDVVVLSTTSHWTEMRTFEAEALAGALLDASDAYAAATRYTVGVFGDGWEVKGLRWHSCQRGADRRFKHWYVQTSTSMMYKQDDFASMR